MTPDALAVTAWLLASIPLLVMAASLLYVFRQWLKYGRKPRRLSKNVLVSEVSMPQIKLPCIVDVSHWKEILDFSVVSPRPALFITKATEGTNFIDDKFVRFFEGAKAVGWRRGCYHFFRNTLNPVQQATHFCNTIRAHVTVKDYLILDMEETGTTSSQIWAWFEEVKKQFPSNRLMIYSRKNLLDPIPMTATEKEYFKKIPVWTAGYPYNPDAINEVPAYYTPDPTKWGPVWLWQYSANGIVKGIQGSVDLNMVTPVFEPILYSDPEPPAPAPAAGRVEVTITARVTDASGKVYEKTIAIDEPLEAV